MTERTEDQQKKNTVRWQKPPRAAQIAIPLLVLVIALGFALAGPAQALYHTNRGGALLAEILGDDPLALACARDPLPQGEQRDQLEEALRALQTAIDADAKAAQAYLDMGRVLCLLGQPQEAIKAFDTYSELRPANPIAQIESAAAYYWLGDKQLAVAKWESAGISASQDNLLLMGDSARAAYLYPVAHIYDQWAFFLADTQLDVYAPAEHGLFVVDDFATAAGWGPCSWCQNSPSGQLEAVDGSLQLSVQVEAGRGQGFSAVSYVRAPTYAADEILLRLHGSPGSFISMEVVLDDKRSRPFDWEELPTDWTTWRIPMEGKILKQLLIGIHVASGQSDGEYSLWLDWIGME